MAAPPSRRCAAAVHTQATALDNLCLLTDSYKIAHFRGYPPGTQYLASYLESRTGARFSHTVFFGLQYILDRHFSRPVTQRDIDEADAIVTQHFGAKLFNRAGWQHIIDHHQGRLPLSIRAVAEGTRVPTGNVLLTVENTDPQCFWLVNYVETLLSHLRYPCTVATQSFTLKQTIARYLEETGGDLTTLDFKLHDFGMRGVESVEAAGIGGAAHLVSFSGSDNLAAVMLAFHHYSAGVAAHSVPAAEHSTITSWTQPREEDAYRNMLQQFPTGIVSVVSDSYDIDAACRELWGKRLHAGVLARDGQTVIRPDSGDPKTMVLRVHELLGEAFGVTRNAKGYKQLNPKVAILQGDGIDVDSLEEVLLALKQAGWCTGSVAFGSGGGLLQKMSRDTQKFAIKVSAGYIDGRWIDIYKDPASDRGKQSKRGRLKLICDEQGTWKTVRYEEHPEHENQLREIYRDGEILARDDLQTIRARLT